MCFPSEIKNFFFVSQVLSFRLTKQTSKNVAATTFKQIQKYFRQQIKRTKKISLTKKTINSKPSS